MRRAVDRTMAGAARTGRGVIALVSVALAPGAASGQELTKQECIGAHADAQRSRRGGHLGEALRQLTRCASASCPAVLRDECTAWYGEVRLEQPLVVFDVRDARGVLVVDATLVEGARVLAAPVGSTGVALDPGAHEFVLRRPAGAEARVKVTLRAGGGVVPVAVRFGAERAASEAERTPPDPRSAGASAGARDLPAGGAPGESAPRGGAALPAAFWVLGGVSAAALGTAAVFGWQGAATQRALERCAPWCDRERIDAMDRRYLVADVALLVAGLSAAGAIWLWLEGSSPPPVVGARSGAAPALAGWVF
ncbi:MAG: hypothetical protein IT376_07715 [Polyangiaceae bacterium]|nr:hypothetical protein [Polyangiaceae bacterium]